MSDAARQVEEDMNRIQFSIAHLVSCIEPAMRAADIAIGRVGESWKKVFMDELAVMVRTAAENNVRAKVTENQGDQK